MGPWHQAEEGAALAGLLVTYHGYLGGGGNEDPRELSHTFSRHALTAPVLHSCQVLLLLRPSWPLPPKKTQKGKLDLGGGVLTPKVGREDVCLPVNSLAPAAAAAAATPSQAQGALAEGFSCR